MNSEEVDSKLSELQDRRRRYIAAVHELQEMGRKMTILARLLADSPTDIRMSSDRESVEFSNEKGEEWELYISRAQLDRLPDQIGGTLLASREIDHLERALTDAGFGDLLSP